LADAVGALSGALADKGHEVSVFLPGYRVAREHPGCGEGGNSKLRLKIEMGDQFMSGDVRAFSPRKNLTVYLICREEFYDRRAPYGNGERDYEDNADRFIFFCKAVVETMRLADLKADIVHAHDWQAALLPLLGARDRAASRCHVGAEDRLHDSQYRLPGTVSRSDVCADESAR